MKKYPTKPEIIVLAGANTEVEKFRIPEVKVRFNRGRMFDDDKITSSKDACEKLKKIAGNMIQTQEMGIFLYLNRANKVLGYYKHSIGGTAGTVFDIKLILAGAVKSLAHGIIACHNHPSGNLQPSDADIRLTKQLKSAAKVHDINLLDHIIVTKNGYFSFSDEGLNGLQGMHGLKGPGVITMENYFEAIKNVNIESLSETLKDGHETMLKFHKFIGRDPEFDEGLEIYVKELNRYLESKNITPAKPKEIKVKKEKIKREHKPKKEPKPKQEEIATPVTFFNDDMKIIRRFNGMMGKSKTVQSLSNLYKTIQKAFAEERITKKNSSYGGLVEDIQDKLVKAVNAAKKANVSMVEMVISDKTFFENIKTIARFEKIYDSIKLLKRYISLQGKETKDKANKLYNEITKALDKWPEIKYANELKEVKDQLNEYIQDRDPEITPPISLHGLINGPVPGQKKKVNLGEIVPTEKFKDIKFTALGLQGAWLKFLGNIAEPFTMMVYGLPGGGKSSFSIILAYLFAHDFDKKVLFIAKEEGISATLQEKFIRLKAAHDKIFITANLIKDLGPYDYVIFDSINELKLTPDDLRKIEENNQGKCFIYIFKTTKTGNFRGSQDYEHLVDISIRVEDGKAMIEKSRFGGSGHKILFQKKQKN